MSEYKTVMAGLMVARRVSSALRAFLESEAAGGLVLIAAAAIALILANSPLAPTYFSLLDAKLGPLSVLHWINDGLMALFFLLVGLEMKRELVDGQLATWPDRILPGIAAGRDELEGAVRVAGQREVDRKLEEEHRDAEGEAKALVGHGDLRRPIGRSMV